MKWMIVCLTICSFLFAADLKIQETTAQDIVIEFALDTYNLTIVKNDGLIFQKIILDSQSSTTMTIGQPELPLITKTLVIPDNASVVIEIISADYQEINITHQVWPHQKLEIDGVSENQEFIIDKQAYQQNSFLPEKIIDVSQTMIWRDLSIARLKISPILYNPGKGILRIYKKLSVRIVFSEPFREIAISRQWLKLYQNTILNFSQVPYHVVPNEDFYLIIVYKDFAEAVDLLVNYYTDQKVQIEKLVIDADWTAEKIKSKIFYYYRFNRLDWVLLVGDAEYVKPGFYEGYTDSFPSDAYFSFLVGDDFYADIGVGRLSGKTAQEISNQIKKIVNYQRSAQGYWLNKTVLIAHQQSYPEKYSACKRDIFNTDYQFFEPEMDTLFGACGATSADVVAAINEGVGLVNYRGHGSTIAWTRWGVGADFNAKYIDNLDNQDKTPVVLNICCLNHKFHWDGGDCLGETWLKKYPGGAVASLGASDPSYTKPNHIYDKSLYQAFYNLNIPEISLASNYAAAKIIEQFGSYGEQNTKMYLWFGDPAMKIKFDPNADKPVYPSGATLKCFPNPSSQRLRILYFLPQNSKIQLNIYDVSGRLVNILESRDVAKKGYHQVFWSGQDRQGKLVSSGIYFIYLFVDNLVTVREKIIWIE